MQCTFKVTFQSRLGLQRSIELCNPEPFEVDKKMWMQIYKLWDRITESEFVEPDEQGTDIETNRVRDPSYDYSRDKPRAEPDMGLSERHGGESTKGRAISKSLRFLQRAKNYQASYTISGDKAIRHSGDKFTVD